MASVFFLDKWAPLSLGPNILEFPVADILGKDFHNWVFKFFCKDIKYEDEGTKALDSVLSTLYHLILIGLSLVKLCDPRSLS